MTIAPFDDRPPDKPHLTSYDERHLADYIRLLDAEEEGADWREAVKIIFGLDPRREPERARVVHDSHLARARWMTDDGSPARRATSIPYDRLAPPSTIRWRKTMPPCPSRTAAWKFRARGRRRAIAVSS